jgi:hypothetical protein
VGRFHFPKLKPGFTIKGISSLKNRLRKFDLWSISRKAIGRTLKRAKYHKVTPVLILVCLLLGYLVVWGVYSVISFKRGVEVSRVKVTEEVPIREEERRPAKEVTRVAIILDDAGGESIDYNEIYSITSPFTISILPGLSGSSRVMKEATSAGKEAILHLPMEPENGSYVKHDGGMVLTSMTDEDIRQVVLRDLKTVPGVSGVNNHMGSRATRDPRVMRAVLSVIKEKGLFFVDSRTASNSLAYDLAREKKVPAGRNVLFLDVEDTEDGVEKRFKQLVGIARSHGFAIGIGHATRPGTVAMLKRLMPIYEREGIKFVCVSSLVR